MVTRIASLAVGGALVGTLLVGPLAYAGISTGEGIGLYTEVQGKVSVVHIEDPNFYPVRVHDGVKFKDVVETKQESKGQALFLDDSLLTVGPESRVEVNEYIYDPNRDFRSSLVKLAQGKVRALVSRIFSGVGSRFEVHTPTAVVASRGTYFVVWVDDIPVPHHSVGASGVANIGDSGAVEFTSGGKTVVIRPGQYSIAEPGMAPSDPALLRTKVPSQVTAAITATDINYGLNPETARQILYNTANAVESPTGHSNEVGGTLASAGSASGTVGGSVGTLDKALGRTVGDLKGTLGGTVGDLGGTLGGAVAGIGGTVSGVMGSIGSTGGGTVASVGNQIGGALPNLGSPVSGTVPSVTGTVAGTVPNVSGAVGGAVSTVAGSVGGTVSSAPSTVAGTVPSVSPSVSGGVPSIPSTVSGAVSIGTSPVGGAAGLPVLR